MCILFIAVSQCPLYPLVMASNRDEFTARATQRPGLGTAFPDTMPHMIAGKDLRAGGTWAVTDTRTGRTATILNVAPSVQMPEGSPSRGALPLMWMNAPEEATPLSFLKELLSNDKGLKYAGFSLVVTSVRRRTAASGEDVISCAVGTNAYKQVRGSTHIQDLSAPGVYAITNDGNVLDSLIASSPLSSRTYWPKARRGHALMTDIFVDKLRVQDLQLNELTSELLLKLLGCRQVEDEHSFVSAGEQKSSGKIEENGQRAWEEHISEARNLSASAEVPIFLPWGEYATRLSTVLIFARLRKRGFGSGGSGASCLHLHYEDRGFDGNADGEFLRLGPFSLDLRSSHL